MYINMHELEGEFMSHVLVYGDCYWATEGTHVIAVPGAAEAFIM